MKTKRSRYRRSSYTQTMGGNVNDFKRDMGTAQGGIINHLRSRSKVKLWQQLSFTAGCVLREEEREKKLRSVIWRNDNQSVTGVPWEEGGAREEKDGEHFLEWGSGAMT